MIFREYDEFKEKVLQSEIVVFDTGNLEFVIKNLKGIGNVKYVVSNDFLKWNTKEMDIQIVSPNILKTISDNLVVLITTPYYAYSVENQLNELGIYDIYCFGFFNENLKKNFKVGFGSKFYPGTAFIHPQKDTTVLIPKLTNRCNCNCPFCGVKHKINKKIPDMPIEQYIKLLDDCKGLWLHGRMVDVVELDGNRELFVYPEWERAVKETQKRGYDMYLVTNGVLMTKEKSQFMIDNDLTRLTISICGITPEIYSMHQGYTDAPNGQFSLDFAAKQLAVVIQNVKDLLEIREKAGKRIGVGISYLINDSSFESIKGAIVFWKEIGVDYFFGNALNVFDEKGNIITARKHSQTGLPREWCYPIHISSTGEYYPCCVYEDYSHGNVFEESIYEIIKSDKYNDFYESLSTGDVHRMNRICANCPAAGTAN